MPATAPPPSIALLALPLPLLHALVPFLGPRDAALARTAHAVRRRLCAEDPAAWRVALDPETGREVYVHDATGETRAEPPAAFERDHGSKLRARIALADSRDALWVDFNPERLASLGLSAARRSSLGADLVLSAAHLELAVLAEAVEEALQLGLRAVIPAVAARGGHEHAQHVVEARQRQRPAAHAHDAAA